MAAFARPAGKSKHGPLAPILNLVKLSIWSVVELVLVNDLIVAAEVRFEETGFHTSKELEAVSGSCCALMVVPTMEGVVSDPLVLVVPFRASSAQLLQKPP